MIRTSFGAHRRHLLECSWIAAANINLCCCRVAYLYAGVGSGIFPLFSLFHPWFTIQEHPKPKDTHWKKRIISRSEGTSHHSARVTPPGVTAESAISWSKRHSNDLDDALFMQRNNKPKKASRKGIRLRLSISLLRTLETHEWFDFLTV